MRNRHKVRRYQYEWSGQQKQWWKKLLSLAVILLVAGGIGWFAFDPVSNLLQEVGAGRPPAESVPPPPEPGSVSAPEPSNPESRQTAPIPAARGLPDSVYYLRPQTVESPALLTAELAKIKALGGTGVVFDLKDDRGMVLYRSDLPSVAACLAQSQTAYDLAATLEAIRGAGLAPVGRLWTFRDTTATSAASMNAGAVKYLNSKVNWLDNAKADGGKAWLNPNSQLARDYILELVGEVTEKGVDCLILDGVQFPTGLSLHLATYGGDPDRSAVLADFLAAARERHGAEVYPVMGLDAAAGVNDTPYGTQPQKLAAAAGGAVLDVRPEQFGIGVTTEKLTLATPLLAPYDTVTAALAAAADTVGQENVILGALVQCYTSTRIEGAANKPYGPAEVAEQVKAAAEAGLTRVFYYSPTGNY